MIEWNVGEREVLPSDRANYIGGILNETTYGEASLEEGVVDLLADIQHYCDQNELDFEDLLSSAQEHYSAERDVQSYIKDNIEKAASGAGVTDRAWAVYTLGEIGAVKDGKYLDEVKVALSTAARQDPDPDVRRAAITTVGNYRLITQETQNALVGATLHDAVREVRVAAVSALGELISPERDQYDVSRLRPANKSGVFAALIRALEDKDAAVRAAAARELGTAGPNRTTEKALRALVKREANGGMAIEVLEAARTALTFVSAAGEKEKVHVPMPGLTAGGPER
jgi:HEAT repeat protein